jgi:hypothetical protein
VVREAGSDPKAPATRAWQLAYAVEPTADEVNGALAFLGRQAERFRAALPRPKMADPQRQALVTFCQALLGSNRFLYID